MKITCQCSFNFISYVVLLQIDGFTMAKDTARLYNEMCSGSRPSDLPPQHSLQCYLVSHGNPRLLLAPFKMEELHVHPPIYQFHDVISDQEIKEIIQASSEGVYVFLFERCVTNASSFRISLSNQNAFRVINQS